ncbi:MAG TPA: G8 domain-containing protein, partial [Puia sp.]|nr:G8 domain-containing protein [Puia sp.]
MKSFIRRHLYAGKPRSILLWILLFAFRQQYVQAQCAAAPIAAAACSGGNGAATNGVNINSGNTYWVNTPTTLTSVNLSGGTLRICSDLTVSTLNYNSGYLVVENGGTLSIGALGSTNLNGNIAIINRGSITIPGNITFQNSGNYIYNDLSTSVFTFSGKVTVNSGGLTLINRGVMNITELYYQGAAGSTTAGICLGPQSITAINKLTNLTANSFTFSGAGSACVNVGVSAQLTSAL